MLVSLVSLFKNTICIEPHSTIFYDNRKCCNTYSIFDILGLVREIWNYIIEDVDISYIIHTFNKFEKIRLTTINIGTVERIINDFDDISCINDIDVNIPFILDLHLEYFIMSLCNCEKILSDDEIIDIFSSKSDDCGDICNLKIYGNLDIYSGFDNIVNYFDLGGAYIFDTNIIYRAHINKKKKQRRNDKNKSVYYITKENFISTMKKILYEHRGYYDGNLL